MSLYKNIALIFMAFLTIYAYIAWSGSCNYRAFLCYLGFIISSYYLIYRRRAKYMGSVELINVLKNLMAYVSITPVNMTCEISKEVFLLIQKKDVHVLKNGAFSIQFSKEDFIKIQMYLERIININLCAARMIDYLFSNMCKDSNSILIENIRIVDVIFQVVQLHEEFQDKIKVDIQKDFLVSTSSSYLICVLAYIVNKAVFNGTCVSVRSVDSMKLVLGFYENTPHFQQKEWVMLNSIVENMRAKLINNITGEIIIEFDDTAF